MTATQLTVKFAEANLGVLSYAARLATLRGEETLFLAEMNDQLRNHAEHTFRTMIGDQLADEVIAMHNLKSEQ